VNRVIRAALLTVACTAACSTYSGLDLEQDIDASAGAASTGIAEAGKAGDGTSGRGGGLGVDTGGTAFSSGGGGVAPGGVGGILLITDGGAPSAGADSGNIAPTGIDVAESTTNVVRTGSEPSVRFADRCPAGQVLIGFDGMIDAAGGAVYLRSIQGVCGTPTLTDTAPWQVSTTPGGTLPLHDQAFPQAQTALCPDGQVVTAFAGRSGLWIDGLEVWCSPLEVEADSLSIGPASAAGYLGAKSGGSAFAAQTCPSGTVAVGQTGGTVLSGDVLGEIGVMCAAVTLLF